MEHLACTICDEMGKRRDAAKRRRGGMTSTPTAATHEVAAVAPATLRYPEIRGLRFSPERRMYLDRDREAARTIARLRTQELLGLNRPAPFCRRPKVRKEGEEWIWGGACVDEGAALAPLYIGAVELVHARCSFSHDDQCKHADALSLHVAKCN